VRSSGLLQDTIGEVWSSGGGGVGESSSRMHGDQNPRVYVMDGLSSATAAVSDEENT
jgi:hypothetical protein